MDLRRVFDLSFQKLLTDDDYDKKEEVENLEIKNDEASVFDNMQQLLDRKKALKDLYRDDPEIKRNKKNRNRRLNI